jgi:hypothetical protein
VPLIAKGCYYFCHFLLFLDCEMFRVKFWSFVLLTHVELRILLGIDRLLKSRGSSLSLLLIQNLLRLFLF